MQVDFFVMFGFMTRKSTFSYGGILIKSPYEKCRCLSEENKQTIYFSGVYTYISGGHVGGGIIIFQVLQIRYPKAGGRGRIRQVFCHDNR